MGKALGLRPTSLKTPLCGVFLALGPIPYDGLSFFFFLLFRSGPNSLVILNEVKDL